jgi:hypothetical protein
MERGPGRAGPVRGEGAASAVGVGGGAGGTVGGAGRIGDAVGRDRRGEARKAAGAGGASGCSDHEIRQGPYGPSAGQLSGTLGGGTSWRLGAGGAGTAARKVLARQGRGREMVGRRRSGAAGDRPRLGKIAQRPCGTLPGAGIGGAGRKLLGARPVGWCRHGWLDAGGRARCGGGRPGIGEIAQQPVGRGPVPGSGVRGVSYWRLDPLGGAAADGRTPEVGHGAAGGRPGIGKIAQRPCGTGPGAGIGGVGRELPGGLAGRWARPRWPG